MHLDLPKAKEIPTRLVTETRLRLEMRSARETHSLTEKETRLH